MVLLAVCLVHDRAQTRILTRWSLADHAFDELGNERDAIGDNGFALLDTVFIIKALERALFKHAAGKVVFTRCMLAWASCCVFFEALKTLALDHCLLDSFIAALTSAGGCRVACAVASAASARAWCGAPCAATFFRSALSDAALEAILVNDRVARRAAASAGVLEVNLGCASAGCDCGGEK